MSLIRRLIIFGLPLALLALIVGFSKSETATAPLFNKVINHEPAVLGASINNAEYCISGDTGECSAPVGYWKMDEISDGTCAGSLDVCDLSGSGNHGDNLGGPVWTTNPPCRDGACLKFDGMDDRVKLPGSASLNIAPNITISAWVYLSPLWSGPGAVVHKGGHYSLYINTSRSITWADSSDWSYGNFGSYGLVPTGQWVHLAAVKDGQLVTLYMNGQIVVSKKVGNAPLTTNASIAHIGCNTGASGTAACVAGSYFKGYIDAVQIYNYPRSSAQIKWDYQQGKPLSWWAMEDGGPSACNATTSTVTDIAGVVTGTFVKVGNGGDLKGAWVDDAAFNCGAGNFPDIGGGRKAYIDLNNTGYGETLKALSFWIKPNSGANADVMRLEVQGAGAFTDDEKIDFDAGSYGSDTIWDNGAGKLWVELKGAAVSGEYISSVKNAGTNTPWSTFAWLTQRPVGKELPSNAGIENGYLEATADMSGSVLLMHFNETSGDIADFSPIGNVGTNNGASYSQTGKLSAGLGFDGANDYINIPNNAALNIAGAFTISGWFKLNSNFDNHTDTTQIIMEKFLDNNNNLIIALVGDTDYGPTPDNGSLVFKIESGSNPVYIWGDNQSWTVGTWYHFTAVFNSTNLSSSRIYINGANDTKNISGTITPNINFITDWNIGGYRADSVDLPGSHYFNGAIDEVTIWTRVLTSVESLDNYERGAMRLKFQVRSCDDSICDSETFIGPDGTPATFYSELMNATASPPTFSLTNVSPNQYFQYKAFFETDNNNFSPELKTVTVDAGGGGVNRTVQIVGGKIIANGFTSPKIYINGTAGDAVLAASWQHVVITGASPFKAEDVELGRIGGAYFDGSLDDVALYNTPWFPPTPIVIPVISGASIITDRPASFTVTLGNAGIEPGYAPFVDIVLPLGGTDGADGLDFVSVSVLGKTLTIPASDNINFTGGIFPGTACINHPYAKDSLGNQVKVCARQGDKLLVVKLNDYGSIMPGELLPLIINAARKDTSDADASFTVFSRGGFLYGRDALDNWNIDPVLLGGWKTVQFMYKPIAISKVYTTSATQKLTPGPNSIGRFALNLNLAEGQLTFGGGVGSPNPGVKVTDYLPNSIAYKSGLSPHVGGHTTVKAPPVNVPQNPPQNELTVHWASAIGTANAVERGYSFDFYVAEKDADDNAVLPSSGGCITITNNAQADVKWVPNPADAGDVAATLTATTTLPLIVCPSIVNKSVELQTDVAPTGYSPQDTLKYTIDFAVSDYRALSGLTIIDTMSDGLQLDAGFAPTLSVTEQGVASSGALNGGNFVTNSPGDGTTMTAFNISSELVTRLGAGSDIVIGGCVPALGGSPNCSGGGNLGKTSGEIVFQAQIRDTYVNPIAGFPNVSTGDILTNVATFTANLLNTADFSDTGSDVQDGTNVVKTQIVGATSGTKTVYAVNGTTISYDPLNPPTVHPGDRITYRITYTNPTSDTNKLVVTDYLPAPLINATELTTFNTSASDPPAAGTARFGGSHTWPGLEPSISIDTNSNAVIFSFPSYEANPNQSKVIDIIFTVTVTSEPYTDNGVFSNYAEIKETSPLGAPSIISLNAPLKAAEPNVKITKGAVAVSTVNSGGVLASAPPTPISAPGNSCPRFGATINSGLLAGTPIISDVSEVDAGDMITFAIVLENQGNANAGAFDLKLKDILPVGLIVPGSAPNLNLCVTYGDTSIPIAYADNGLFTGGIEITDGAQGAIPKYSAASGANIIVITYDLEVSSSVYLSQTILNGAEFMNFAAKEGGTDFTGVNPIDPVTVSIVKSGPAGVPTIGVSATSEDHTVSVAGIWRVAIGEIVRYRFVSRIHEGTSTNLNFYSVIPGGLEFLNDNTAKVAFVSSGGTPAGTNIISNTLDPVAIGCADGGATALRLPGDETTIAAITPKCPLLITPNGSATDKAVSQNFNIGSDNDTYGNGVGVYFKFADAVGGTVINADRDPNYEYIVVEANYLVRNQTNIYHSVGLSTDLVVYLNVNGTNLQVGNATNHTIRVAEPYIAQLPNPFITTIIPVIPDAGDTFTFTINVVNSNAASPDNSASAFELVIQDAINSNLTLLGVVPTVPVGVTAVDNSNLATNSVKVDIDRLNPGETVSLEVKVKVADTIAAGLNILEDPEVTYTGLPGLKGTDPNLTGSSLVSISAVPLNWTDTDPGEARGERTDVDGCGNPNTCANYYKATPNPQVFIIIDNPTISKLAVSPINYTIGEEIIYRYLITMPEGDTNTLTLVDNIPDGLDYKDGSYVLIDTVAASGGVLGADYSGVFSGPPTITGGTSSGSDITITYDAGTKITRTNTDNNFLNDQFLVQITATVLNEKQNLGFSRSPLQAYSGVESNRANTVTLSYNDPDLGQTNVVPSSSTTIKIVEPAILIDKFIVSPPDPPDAGSTVTYGVAIKHAPFSGNPAYNLSFKDIIPGELIPPDPANPGEIQIVTTIVPAPTYDVSGQTFLIPAAGTFDMSATDTLILVFKATLIPTFVKGTAVTNEAEVKWTSLPTAHPNNGGAYERISDGATLLGGGAVGPPNDPLNDYKYYEQEKFQYASCSKLFQGNAEFGYCSSEGYCNLQPVAGIVLKQVGTVAATPFKFTGEASYDDITPLSQLKARWDFDYNGAFPSWDLNFAFADNIFADTPVTYTYTAPGNYTIAMQVQDQHYINSPITTKDIGLTGGGVGFIDINPRNFPATAAPYAFSYGIIAAATSKQIILTVCNLGEGDLDITGWGVGTGTQFTFSSVAIPTFTLSPDPARPTSCSSSVAAASQEPVTLTFNPGGVSGTYTDTFTINYKVKDVNGTEVSVGSRVINLEGTGRTGAIVTPDTTPVEQFKYDGRILINPPPGFVEFLERVHTVEPAKPR